MQYIILAVFVLLFAVLVYFNLARLLAVIMLGFQTFNHLCLAMILYFAVPGAVTQPGGKYWYIPFIIALGCLVLTVFCALDKGRSPAEPAKPAGPLRWLTLLAGLVVSLYAVLGCLFGIYVGLDIAFMPQGLFNSLALLVGGLTLGSLPLYLACNGSKAFTWICLGSLFFVSFSASLIMALICLYSLPGGKIAMPDMAAFASLGSIPVSLLIWGVNAKRRVN
jgi:hypothetical protein